MNRKSFFLGLGVLAAFCVYPLIAWAQQEFLMTGQDSSGTTRIVRVDSNGNLATGASHPQCTNTTMNVGTTGTSCPASQLSTRSSILIQLVQTGETLTVTTDGPAASATAGIQISSGSTYSDDLLGTVAPNCRCTAATCSVRVVECR